MSNGTPQRGSFAVGTSGGNGNGHPHGDPVSWPVAEAARPQGHGDCAVCRGRCCTYVTAALDKPTDEADVDEIRWFLAHRNLLVFVEDGEWYVQFFTPCRHLNEAGLCDIHGEHFDVCREHGTDACEMSGGEVQATTFTRTEQFDAWWAQQGACRNTRRARRPARGR